MSWRQRIEAMLKRGVSLLPQWRKVETGLSQRPQTIIHATIQLDNFCMTVQQGNCRQEALTLQSVFVKPVWVNVRGRNQHDASIEQMLKKPTEDHGISNIRHEKLIETQHPGLVGNSF